MATDTREKGSSLGLMVQIIIALGLLGYAGYRAAKIDFVYDEVCSYFWYAHDSLWEIYLGVPPTVNNHWLNSLFMKFSVVCFGPNELAMRWHSVAALGIYLAIVIVWLREIRDFFLRLAGFMLLTCNPYLLDFFSLARGYGLAMTFTLGGAMGLCRWVATGKIRWGWVAVGCGIAAVLANLCSLLFFGAFLAVVCIKGIAASLSTPGSWRAMLVRFWQTTYWVWLGTTGAVIILAIPVVRLMGTNAFYVGGQNGFWRDTIQTLVFDSLYRVDYGIFFHMIVYGVEGVVVLSLVVGGLMILMHIVQNRWATIEEAWCVMFVLLLTSGLASIALHVFAGSNYLADRLATFLLPLFLMYAVLLAQSFWPDTGHYRRLVRGLAIVVMFACGFHFLRSANVKWTYEWRYNYQTREVLSDILTDARQRDLSEVRLGVTALFHPSIGYYREVNHNSWLIAAEKDWGQQKFDYYYIKDGLDNPPDGGRNLVTLKIYPDIGARLLRRE
jgi:hypothetical protein